MLGPVLQAVARRGGGFQPVVAAEDAKVSQFGSVGVDLTKFGTPGNELTSYSSDPI